MLRTTCSTRPLAASAVSTTRPPSASITPEFVTSAAPPSGRRRTLSVTSMESSPSPARSRRKLSAPATTAAPRRAVIRPLFAAPGATRAARPRSATVMLPWFSTRAPGRSPPPRNSIRPAMKSSLAIRAVVATSEPTLTCAVPVNTTPEGFTMATPPLAVMRPAMVEGSGVMTRFSVQELAEGCAMFTWASRPTSKRCHSITARLLDCVTCMRAPDSAMAAAPAVTCPPVGSCPGAWASAAASQTGAISAVEQSSSARPERATEAGRVGRWRAMGGARVSGGEKLEIRIAWRRGRSRRSRGAA